MRVQAVSSTTVGASMVLMALFSFDAIARNEVVECLVVDNVKEARPVTADASEPDQNRFHINAGHQMQAGTERMLSIRKYATEPGVADSQEFLKVTAHLPAGDDMTIDNASFSSGWTGYSYRGDAWTAKEVPVRITPSQASPGMVRVTGKFDAFNDFRRSSQTFDIDLTCKIRNVKFKDLSPWQGGAGSVRRSFSP